MIATLSSRRTLRPPRRGVMLRAAMRVGRHDAEVCIRDISSRGMLLMARNPPPVGFKVKLDVPGMDIVGTVQWTGDRRFGVNILGRLDVDAVIAKLRNRAPKKVKKEPAATEATAPAATIDELAADNQMRLARSETLSRSLQWAMVSLGGLSLAGVIGMGLYLTLTHLTGALAKAF